MSSYTKRNKGGFIKQPKFVNEDDLNDSLIKLGRPQGKEDVEWIRSPEDIPASKFRAHVEKGVALTNGKRNKFSEEYNFVESMSIFNHQFAGALQAVNKKKNRYANILAPDHSRVLLSPTAEEGSDYINANFVSGLIPGSDRLYIAAQGPVLGTISDFWKMVWESNASVIIMLTKEIEKGMIKCDEYWPVKLVEPVISANFIVTLLESKNDSSELVERHMEVLNTNNKEKRHITQVQYVAWPDHGIPPSTLGFLSLLEDANTYNTSHGPIVTHCSAGIGRTGTFLAVHSVIEKLKLDLKSRPHEDPLVNVPKTLLTLRESRPGLVQTEDQYTFVNLAIAEKIDQILHK